MAEMLSQPWPWWVAGPLIGLMVPGLLLVGGNLFGVSANLRHVCAAILPSRLEFLQYDWRSGTWNLVFALGILAGGVVSATLLDGSHSVGMSDATRQDLAEMGIRDFTGLAPEDLYSWTGLMSLEGFVSLVVGGILIGFGSRYAGGCTSGHAITGLAAGELPSLLTVLGFFAGGLAATHLVLPLLF